MRKKAITVILAMLLVVLPLCQSEGKERDYWPTEEWRSSSPNIQGLNSTIIEKMGEYIGNNQPYTDSMLLVRHGYIVFEKYYKRNSEDLRPLTSVTKSVISAVLGIAIDKGLVKSIDQKMMDLFPDYDSETIDSSVREITLRHLLTMSAIFSIFPDPDFIGAVFEKPLAKELGKYFVYDNSCPQIVSVIVTNVCSLAAADFASEYLFKPIGIKTHSWEELSGYSDGGEGLYLRPRDMAKFGYLYLNKGSWNGKQIISEEWITESTINQISGLIAGEYSDSYGYYWWIDETSGYKFYFALGLGHERGGEVIAVLPDLDIVFVTTTSGSGFAYSAWKSLLENFIVPSVLK
jgi:CubicO group peptidase (beta-lactamase class C family)